MVALAPPPPPPAEPRFVYNNARVTLGWMDGRMQNRQLGRFTPRLSVLAASSGAAGEAHEPVPVDKLAYVAFVRRTGEARERLPNTEAKPLRIHVAGGKKFDVFAGSPDPSNPVDGFYAVPSNDDSPFSGFFFYTHGINALESVEPLAALLVQDGHTGAADVERGLAMQHSQLGQILVEQQKVTPESVVAAIGVQERKRMRLGEVLIEAGLATQRDIEQALAEQKKRRGRKIGEILVDTGVLSEVALATTLAKKFHLPFADLNTVPQNPQALNMVPRELIERYGFLPVAVDALTLTVAIADPLNTEVSDILRFQVPNKRVQEVMVTASQLKQFVARYVEKTAVAADAGRMSEILKELAADDVSLESDSDKQMPTLSDNDSGVIKMANQIILDAVRRGASDIHIEPKGAERNLVVRFRIDGECMVYQEVPPNYRAPLVARIKIMSQLDIAERRKPQDGKIRFRAGDRVIELRVATIPTVNGNEDVVLRILASSRPMPLDQMGFSERNLRELTRIVKQPYGLILCVGPTGSGKTTTLHSALGYINTPDMKIWTAEDPVEITQDGLRQVQVQPKVGFTFEAAMRAFLRADPDVIMVGEMRDRETAGTAIEASLTGHLVMSTLHTNSAPETITRLLDMDLDPFSFADALLGVVAQRLARRLCLQCRTHTPSTRGEFAELVAAYGSAEALEQDLGVRYSPELRLWRAVGCETCGRSGYAGRIPLHEVLITDDAMKRAIQQKAPVHELRRQAITGGMTTLAQDGVAKLLAGHTDLRQVLAVCSR